MPFFKTTYNILTKYDEDELFDPNWMDSDKLILPPLKKWNYERELDIEDIEIWEVLYEASNGMGVYASWFPYAEFYMITKGYEKDYSKWRYIDGIPYQNRDIETFYGKGASKKVFNRCKEIGINLNLNHVWVDDEEMWLYQ